MLETDEFERCMNGHCRYWTFNDKQLQSVVSQFCGHYCISYCLYRSSGIDKRKIVCSFTSDTALNDVLVHALVCRIRKKIKTHFKCTNVSFIPHTHTHTHTILMSLLFDEDFSNVKVRMTTTNARCSVVVEHLATSTTGVEVCVLLSLGYDEGGRVV